MCRLGLCWINLVSHAERGKSFALFFFFILFYFLLFFEAPERVLLFGAVEFKRGPGKKKKALTCYLSHLCPSLPKNNVRSLSRRRSSLSAVNKWADATLGEQMGLVFCFFCFFYHHSAPRFKIDRAGGTAVRKTARQQVGKRLASAATAPLKFLRLAVRWFKCLVSTAPPPPPLPVSASDCFTLQQPAS